MTSQMPLKEQLSHFLDRLVPKLPRVIHPEAASAPETSNIGHFRIYLDGQQQPIQQGQLLEQSFTTEFSTRPDLRFTYHLRANHHTLSCNIIYAPDSGDPKTLLTEWSRHLDPETRLYELSTTQRGNLQLAPNVLIYFAEDNHSLYLQLGNSQQLLAEYIPTGYGPTHLSQAHPPEPLNTQSEPEDSLTPMPNWLHLSHTSEKPLKSSHLP